MIWRFEQIVEAYFLYPIFKKTPFQAYTHITYFAFVLHQVLYLVLYLMTLVQIAITDCPKRRVITDTSGNITLRNTDYGVNTYCQWLIEGEIRVFVSFDTYLCAEHCRPKECVSVSEYL